jgi:hypothetical protein
MSENLKKMERLLLRFRHKWKDNYYTEYWIMLCEQEFNKLRTGSNGGVFNAVMKPRVT